ncbi:MAG TPA: pyridoxal-phosphate dependent enzyme [Candidatus Kapabacteria bacterium]|nr:pyridoxal-phosphate dependent enzyme [Candidatus Kapabacteria bacterium]HPO61523.1 pyridoxal-phosphate dependent enzyme [Candidatus Kapabacteria bacterium]
MQTPNIQDVLKAAKTIANFSHITPILTCKTINKITNNQIFFKCENFQKIGAFKFRGACNAVFSLPEELAKKGVTTHSSGNHAQALALAAKISGINATVVMPDNSSAIKIDAVRNYGANIIFCKPDLISRETTLNERISESGETFIHPYDNFKIIAGQGTAALELLNEVKDLDYVIAPVGGGGLLSGTLISCAALSPNTKVIAAEPEGADDAYRSLIENRIVPSVNPKTIADGLLTSLGELNFKIIKENIYKIVTVSEEAITNAMKLIWERMKIIVEPSSATTLAVLLENKIEISGKRIGIILSGGNVDLKKLPF